ncbi:ParB/RepB/Spo0J family partition protein [Nakamurella sp. UYEF19]|uniref:ParB/RepB/Spo0J family partition protein n=1 Tax=Nakamurella sp. UYEF19 TaxID=1756392 RepID=UPI003396F217
MPPRARPNLTAAAIGPIDTTDQEDPNGIVASLTGTTTVTGPPTKPVTVPLVTVVPHPENARTGLGDLTDLAASMQTLGVITPLTVVSIESFKAANPKPPRFDPQTQWVIIAGHRRHAAAAQAGLTELPISVRNDLAGDENAVAAMLIENIHRAALDPMDEAAALQRLSEGGMKQRDIATRTGISQSQVSKRLALLKLPTDAQDAVRAGTLQLQDAARLMDLPPANRLTAYDNHIKYRWSIDVAVKEALRALEVASETSRSKSTLAADKIRIIDPRTEFGRDSWSHSLRTPADIEGARRHKSLLGSITERTGEIEYWTTADKPWPWNAPTPGPITPRDSTESKPDDQPIDPDDVSNAPTDPEPSDADKVAAELAWKIEQDTAREAHATRRADRIRDITSYLASSPSPEQTLEYLTLFVLSIAFDYSDARTQQFAGLDADTWNTFQDWLGNVAHRDPAARTAAALAVAMSGMEQNVAHELADQPFDATGQAHLAALIDYLDDDQ